MMNEANATAQSSSMSENRSTCLNNMTTTDPDISSSDTRESSVIKRISSRTSQKRKTILLSQSSNSKLPRIDEQSTATSTKVWQIEITTTPSRPSELKVPELNDRIERLFPDPRVIPLVS
jgi:hypothetical protein